MDMGGGEGLLILVIIGGFWLAPMFIAANIWEQKGGSGGIGFLMGLFLGWIGVIIAAVATPTASAVRAPSSPGVGPSNPYATRECPFCKETMRRDASVCPHCRHDSKPWTMHDGHWWVVGDDGEHHWFDEQKNEWVRFSAPSARPGVTEL
jgi:hypothetical protein